MGALKTGLCKLFSRRNLWWLIKLLIIFSIPLGIGLLVGKLYQNWDDDPARGAIAIENGAFGENYSTPIYLDQGWDENDSLWYYNTTQGSALMPYDFFIALEQSDSTEPFRANSLIDKYRYLPQKPTFFNPDGLPVGFVKESYKGNDYVGYTCAACHTGQVNYKGNAIRIDGGPAMADMVGFLTDLQKSLDAAKVANSEKNQRFIAKVLELNNSYSDAETVQADLIRWARKIQLYNNINASKVDYGYARLDAFGRIYNRVLEHVISRNQLRDVLLGVTKAGTDDIDLLTPVQVDKVLDGISETIIGDLQFAKIIDRLVSTKDGYPGLSMADLHRIKALIFNEPNAPVSYPFLWDIVQSDYVQWNALASNGGVGPLGRNTGEVIGVFGILDWTAHKRGWSLSSFISGQKSKSYQIDFASSIDLVNLARLEAHLSALTSPVWPTQKADNPQQEIAKAIFDKLPEWQIDGAKVRRGRALYAQHCESCHEVIDRTDRDRIVVASMAGLDVVDTDRAMAENSVNYKGYAGNFKNTYQTESVGALVIKDRAPVVQILTAATLGEVATSPDPDKWPPRRALDWLYMMAKSFFDNKIEASVKSGNYQPDTTAEPYRSLLSYKARSLNGIWATAPYLHNGSVPSIYDLLLPVKREGDSAEGLYRPTEFKVGSREFDPIKIGLRTEGYEGFTFKADKRGDFNSGHEYGTVHAPKVNGKQPEPLTDEERWDLVEYIKIL